MAQLAFRRGKKALGVESLNGHFQSLAHEYWKRFYARRYAEVGCRVHLEAPFGDGRADVLAWKGKEIIAIEIETGMSDAVANVKRDLRAGARKVMVVATDEKAMKRLERELGELGLLIQNRVILTPGYPL